MGSYKHIETFVGEYIVSRYSRAVEVGIGKNTSTAEMLSSAGVLLHSTDITGFFHPPSLHFVRDDVFDPDYAVYQGADVIYAIRPAVEMIPPLIALAQRVNSDLLIYHLGFEIYENGGERIDCGVILHRYYRRSEPVKEG